MALIKGNDSDNTYKGTKQDDNVYGYGGNDTLGGGQGNDTLAGGEGADTYLIAKHNGLNMIDNVDTDHSVDVIRFIDVDSTDVTQVTRHHYNSLTLSYGGDSQVTINRYFYSTDDRIDLFQFSNGVIWSWEDIKPKVLQASNGDDDLEGYDDSDDNLSGLAGNDHLYGNDGNDTLDGGSEHDYLYGGNGNDALTGGPGNDNLHGDEGNDTLSSGAGNDDLYGGAGTDTYLIAEGDGHDVINNYNDNQSVDVVKFTDVNSTDVTRIFRYGDSLMLKYGSNNSVAVENYFAIVNGCINQFQFSDGIIWSWTDIKTKALPKSTAGNNILLGYDDENEFLSGLAGNDEISGGNGDDTLNGGLGNDYLMGGEGSDIYLIANNDGQDLIEDFKTNDSMNVVKFTDVASTDITKIRRDVYDNLILRYGEDNQLTIESYFYFYTTINPRIDQFQFSDGVIWSWADIKPKALQKPTDGDDEIWGYDDENDLLSGLAGNDGLNGGAGNDTLSGGTGNNHLDGGTGSDTYIIANNGGWDSINNGSYDDAQSIDVVKFIDVASTDITQISHLLYSDALYLSYGNNGWVVISDYFSHEKNRIDQFQFSDGVIWNWAILKWKVLQPTGDDDLQIGYRSNDTLSGLAGNDRLLGADGNDTLNGGTGYDYLKGGNGADTYLIANNDGQDVIANYDDDYSIDVVKFTDVDSTELTQISYLSNSLVLNYGSGGQLIIEDYFSAPAYRIDQFQFSDGVIWRSEDIQAKILQATDGDEVLHGYNGNDTLTGLAGNDTLYGSGGNDTLNGGTGNDYLVGGLGADTYLIAKNDGQDIISSYGNGHDIDVVKFTDVASTDVKISSIYFNLLLSYGGDNQVTIVGYLYSQKKPIGSFQFSDGVTLSWADIKLKAQQATDGDDVFYGYKSNNKLNGGNGKDTLVGNKGNDMLKGESGNDSLAGGYGNDTLNGGLGNDYLDGSRGFNTYLFAKNDGQDEIWNSEALDAIDIIKFTDVALSDITAITRTDAGSLVIRSNTSDQLKITSYYYYPENYLFQFTDGLLTSFIVDIEADNILTGTMANDALVGLAGIDKLSGGIGDDLYLLDNPGDTVLEMANTGNDTVLSSVDFTLEAQVENLVLLKGALSATGNQLDNALTGNHADNTLSGLVGNDSLNGNNGKDTLLGGVGADTLNGGSNNDVLSGGLDKDNIMLAEANAATDTVKIAAGDSTVSAYDTVNHFALGNGVSAVGSDRLDLDSIAIAADVTAVDGVNVGVLKSHAINGGMIHFDNIDSYAAALALKPDALVDIFQYLQNNINAGETVAFNAAGNTYVFQNDSATATLVQLTATHANNLNNTGLIDNGVWLI